jgi:hypothetical protein
MRTLSRTSNSYYYLVNDVSLGALESREVTSLLQQEALLILELANFGGNDAIACF